MSETLKDRIRTFWDREPCGTREIIAAEGTPEFFARLEREREEREPFIEHFARFHTHCAERVLEVGVGPGTDFIRFVRGGAICTGVDLTRHAVDLTRRRLELEGLEATVLEADTEELPFGDETFDFVYSWGVIHHTPDINAAAREIARVTRPGGRICVMIYHRRSLVGLQSWFVNGLGRGQPWRLPGYLISHHHESPGTTAFTIPEARRLFDQMRDVTVTPVVTPYDLRLTRSRQLPGVFGRIVPRGLGWFLVIEGEKPSPSVGSP
jgi:ubiquinone/menaquinone biosynthesis C-methylase UbiE